MSRITRDDYSNSMLAAERELDGRIDYAYQMSHDVRAKLEQSQEKLDNQEPPSDAEVEQFQKFVTGHGRTEQWQGVIDKVRDGELSWRQVVDSIFTGRELPEVRDAMASLTEVQPATKEELLASGIIREDDDAAAERGEQSERQEEDDQSRYFAADQDDEEWYDDNPPPWRG